MAAKRIAVLFHAGDRNNPTSGSIVDHLAKFWREDGHDVVYLFGVESHVAADLILVHVNLSVVPDEYLAFAARYPIVLNGKIRDIRKSVVSTNLVHSPDAWSGPVIVKSDLNFGGVPEKMLTPGWLEQRSRIWRGAQRALARLSGRDESAGWKGYKVYERYGDVPRSLRKRRDVVVERFLPELENGHYHLRMYQVLGDRWSCTRIESPDPVLKAANCVSSEPVDPHPEVLTWRRRFNLDYGKLDYVVHEGRPVLLDVNKTTGASPQMGSAPLSAMRRRLAEGLYSYFT